MRRFYHVHVDTNNGRKVIFDPEPTGLVTAYHEQTEAAPIWTLQHDQNTNKLIVQVEVDGDFVPYPQISLQDLNTIAITFPEPVTGKVKIIFFNNL